MLKKLFWFCVLVFAGSALYPGISFADSVCTLAWPTVAWKWHFGLDNYYTTSTTSSGEDMPDRQCIGTGQIDSACATECESVHVVSCSVYIDGQLVAESCGSGQYFGVDIHAKHARAEGNHIVQVNFTLRGTCSGDRHSYSFTKAFYVDNTPPTVVYEKPENNVSISTDDLNIIANVSDDVTKVGIVQIEMWTGSPCHFHHDLFGLPLDSTLIIRRIRGSYCSHEYDYSYSYFPCWQPPDCVDIGTTGNLPINYDLQDHVDFSHGQDCEFGVEVMAFDRVCNSTETWGLSFIVDQAAPLVAISTCPGYSFIPTPAVAGTATDSSEIKSVALKIMQTDWREIETYWNGSEWTSNESAKIDLSITPSTSVAFEYDGLNDSDISSGSHYKLTVEAIDEFDHIGKSMVGFSSGEISPITLPEMEFVVFEVQITQVDLQNDGVSFTTRAEDNENIIVCQANLSPDILDAELNSQIQWEIDDDPNTTGISGDPDDPQIGPDANLIVTAPPAPNGRGFPLNYQIRASLTIGIAEHIATHISEPWYIIQDEKDQCRQEYIDMDKATKPLRGAFSNSGGSANFSFAELNKGDFSWAIITSGLTSGLEATRTNYGHPMSLNSAYRNPIRNTAVEGVPESRHIYGVAADVAVEDLNDNGTIERSEWDELAAAAGTAGAWVESYDLTLTYVHMNW